MCSKKNTYQVIQRQFDTYTVQNGAEQLFAKLLGKFSRSNEFESPLVGDKVYIIKKGNKAFIDGVAARKTKLSRKAAGSTVREQVLAVNMDYVFVVVGLDRKRGYSDRLIERYMVMAWNSGAVPVLVLNKIDTEKRAEIIKRHLEIVAPDVEILLCSAKSGEGINELKRYLAKGQTAVIIGPSGAGKSTISNALCAQTKQRIGDLSRIKKRGKHTTTNTIMLRLENGGYIMDSPGLREIQLWPVSEGVNSVFEEITALTNECKFNNCSHQGEPGCAIQYHLSIGSISPERYDSYLELMKELHFTANKLHGKKKRNERKKAKQVTKQRKARLQKKVVY